MARVSRAPSFLWLVRKISLIFDKDNKLVGVSIRDLSISP